MDRRKLIESYITFLPLLYKKFFKNMTVCGVSKHQLGFLFHLKFDGGKSMTYYGSKLMISKSNLSVMADKLIEEGLVERDFSQEDRRVIILRITEKGQNYLNEHIDKFIELMLNKFEILSDDEINRLFELMEESKKIFSKLEDEE